MGPELVPVAAGGMGTMGFGAIDPSFGGMMPAPASPLGMGNSAATPAASLETMQALADEVARLQRLVLEKRARQAQQQMGGQM